MLSGVTVHKVPSVSAWNAISNPPSGAAAIAGLVPGATPRPLAAHRTTPSGPSSRRKPSELTKATSYPPPGSATIAGLVPAAISTPVS